jgi:hypothetical protein
MKAIETDERGLLAALMYCGCLKNVEKKSDAKSKTSEQFNAIVAAGKARLLDIRSKEVAKNQLRQ